MRKHLLLFVLMLVPMLAIADASGTCGDNLTWTFETATGTLTISGTGAMNNYDNSSAGRSPWYKNYRSKIKTVVIEDGVTRIGSYAFDGCTHLWSVTIPNSVTSIYGWAFRDCTVIEAIEIPNSVKVISSGTFYNCYQLASINIPDGISEIRENTFRSCSSLTSIVIPNSVTSIGVDAFWGSGLTAIDLPNSVTTIGGGAFSGSGLTSLSIPNSVTSIGYEAFLDCSNLASISIPNSVTEIGDRAFENCSNLTKVELNSNTIASFNYGWNGNDYKSLRNVFGWQVQEYIIGESVTSIGNSAFYNCTNLKYVTIPSNLSEIGYGAFSSCSNLTVVHITDLEAWCRINFQDYSANPLYYAHHLYLNGEEVKEVNIPNSFTSIGNCTFVGCSELTSVNIPNSVTSIGGYTFAYCSSLATIDIPNSVTSIGAYAFSGCSGLTSISFPNNMTNIEEGTFSGCSSLTSVTIPNNITAIGRLAFANCTGLITFAIPNRETNIGEGILYRCTSLSSLTLSCEVIDAWFTGSNKLPSLTEVILGEGVKTVKENAFLGCTNIKTIDLGSTITSIEARAFSGTDKLTDVTCRATTVPEMDRTAFENSYPNYAMLHVPAVSITAYQSTAPWSEFKEVVAIKPDLPVDAEQCATPTISYKNGKLSFASATEGVEYLYQITDNDIKSGLGAEVSLDATYHISVYATKEGYKDSETAIATLCWIEQKPATEGITDGIANVPAKALLIKNNGGQLTVEGADDGEAISVYTVNGVKNGSAISQNGAASIYTNLQAGSIAILKIGDKSVKVVIK